MTRVLPDCEGMEPASRTHIHVNMTGAVFLSQALLHITDHRKSSQLPCETNKIGFARNTPPLRKAALILGHTSSLLPNRLAFFLAFSPFFYGIRLFRPFQYFGHSQSARLIFPFFHLSFWNSPFFAFFRTFREKKSVLLSRCQHDRPRLPCSFEQISQQAGRGGTGSG